MNGKIRGLNLWYQDLLRASEVDGGRCAAGDDKPYRDENVM